LWLGEPDLTDILDQADETTAAWDGDPDWLVLIFWISVRSSVSICGRPPNGRDFQRQ
jgi:hypothetical protein